MDIRKVKKLIELLEESGIAEIEIHEGEESVRISRGSTIVPPQTMINVPQAQAVPAVQASDSIKSHLAVDESAGAGAAGDNYADQGHVVTSPMVGIFYSSPSPEEPEFVSRGQSVKTGEVLCIIEAMKIMNQIESDVSGKLVRTLVENGEAVEYGQPLFIIEPA
ncbi:MAG: acetyl-CoA carboxylase biotin carboxyl carrier protein subunit [marine bacterium B5-7]|nr:MAG: acetyl-CoA carboxylase biotin carboxyl carrier protein subunit [marine bacterium B5-7]